MAIKLPGLTDTSHKNKHGDIYLVDKTANQADSSLEWYRLTESSRSLLNSVIAATTREKIKLRGAINSDKKRLAYLEGLNEEAYSVTQNGENFESIAKMKAIIAKYKTILDSLQSITV